MLETNETNPLYLTQAHGDALKLCVLSKPTIRNPNIFRLHSRYEKQNSKILTFRLISVNQQIFDIFA